MYHLLNKDSYVRRSFCNIAILANDSLKLLFKEASAMLAIGEKIFLRQVLFILFSGSNFKHC